MNDEGKVFPLAVKEGDRVLFGKYAGTEIKIDGEDFVIMREEEVLGILVGSHGRDKKETVGWKQSGAFQVLGLRYQVGLLSFGQLWAEAGWICLASAS